jgi:hypothetical protein
MPDKLKPKTIRGIIFKFFRDKTMWPLGTTSANWKKVQMKDFNIDTPALHNDPHYEARKLSIELQLMFLDVDAELKRPLAILKSKSKTVADLLDYCEKNHKTL